VANAIAPLAAVIYIYRFGELDSEAPVNKWILAYGGLGIVLGLLLYGYKVMKTIGYQLTVTSPTRGSSAGLASSLVVATASYIGIPVSTTQCIVGAVSGVGLVEGKNNVQWWQLAKVCVSWIVIFFVSVLLSAGLFCLCAYSPSLAT
jgi:sodium-dependent phosphate transporter